MKSIPFQLHNFRAPFLRPKLLTAISVSSADALARTIRRT